MRARYLKNLKIIFGSMNPGNSLEFYVKTLNPLGICERHKNRSTLFSLSKFHTVLPSTEMRKDSWSAICSWFFSRVFYTFHVYLNPNIPKIADLFLCHSHLHQLGFFLRKIIDTSLECCIDPKKSWNKW